jgi:septal ring factor EnvC (AmiA/AmiB activator)
VTAQAVQIEQLEKSKQDTRASLERRIYDMECELSKQKEARASCDEENKKLSARVKTLETEVAIIPVMEMEIRSLRDQIVELGGKPKTGPLKGQS